MSHRSGDVFHIRVEPPAECELCGTFAELRPYGPNEENVCFTCAKKDEEAMKRAMSKRLKGVSLVTAPEDFLAKQRRS